MAFSERSNFPRTGRKGSQLEFRLTATKVIKRRHGGLPPAAPGFFIPLAARAA